MGEMFHMQVPGEPTAYSKTGVEVQPDSVEAAALAQAAVDGQQPLPVLEVVEFGDTGYNVN